MSGSREILMKAVENLLPATWNTGTLIMKDSTYNIFEVQALSDEFIYATNSIKLYKDCFKIIWVRRIQNVYKYGSYCVRKQQLEARSAGTAREEIRYLCISEDQIATVATHNLDQRHIVLPPTIPFEIGVDPRRAIEVGCQFPTSTTVLVMARVITEKGSIESMAELYPEYLVKLDQVNHNLLRDIHRNN